MRVAVLFSIGAIAVAVLEVDPKILHGLVPELADDSGPDGLYEGRSLVRSEVQFQRLGEGSGIRRVLFECPEGNFTEPAGGVRAKQVRAAVNSVNGLTSFDLAGPRPGGCRIRATKGGRDGCESACSQ